MQASALAIITLRREIAARYERVNRLWLRRRTAYRRLHEAPVQNLTALRDAAARLDQLSARPRGAAARPEGTRGLRAAAFGGGAQFLVLVATAFCSLAVWPVTACATPSAKVSSMVSTETEAP